jgi:lambda family phage tail tape measure protein
MNIGTLTIEMAANIGRLTKDMGDAKSLVSSSMKSMQESVDLFKKAFVAMTGVASFAAFKGMIDGVIETKVQLKHLSDMTGASVEALSAIGAVSKLTGTDIGTVGSAMNKLQKNLASSTEESKGAAQAIKALGLDFGAFSHMSADQQMLAVAKAMAQFTDGGGKAAAAMLLFGKAGAQLLPMLKDLANENELVGKQTAESAHQAEEYEKNIKKLQTASAGLRREFVEMLLPSMEHITAEMIRARKEGDGLFGMLSAGVKAWWEGNPEQANNKKLFDLGGQLIEAQNNVDRSSGSSLQIMKNRVKVYSAEVQSILKQIAAVQALRSVTEPDNQSAAESNRLYRRKELDPNLGAKPASVTTADPGLALLNELKTKQEALTGSTSEYEQTLRKLDAIQKDVDPARRKEIQTLALQNDQIERMTKAVTEAAKYQSVVLGAQEASAKQYEADLSVLAKLNEAQALQVQQLGMTAPAIAKANFERDVMTKSLAANVAMVKYGMDENWDAARADEERTKILREETEALRSFGLVQADVADKLYNPQRGIKDALDDYAEHVKQVGVATKNMMGNAFQGMEDALVKFVTTGKLDFKSLANSIIADMVRMQVQQSIMKPFTAGFQSGGGIGGGLSELWNSITGRPYNYASNSQIPNFGAAALIPGMADGGTLIPGQPTLVGERGPELIIPSGSGTVVPNGKIGGSSINLTNHITIDARTDRSEVYALVVQANHQSQEQLVSALRQQGVFT